MKLPETYYFKKTVTLLESHFDYDFEKMWYWLTKYQPGFGGIPEQFFLDNEGEQVLQYVKKMVGVCDFCTKPCSNEQCFTKDDK